MTVLLPEQTLTGFGWDPLYSAYALHSNPAPFPITEGETYRVVWDGVEYLCVAFAYSYFNNRVVGIGNAASLGLAGGGEPFLMTYTPAYDAFSYFSQEGAPTHTAAVYPGAEPVGVVIRNAAGEDVAYYGVEEVVLRTTDGGRQVFRRVK